MSNILVVGASSGVGKDAAIALSAQGHQVFVTARRASNLTQLESEYANVHAYPFDLVNWKSADELLKNIVAKHGKLDSIVYCAGQQYMSPLRLSDLDAIEKIFEVNTLGVFSFLKAFSSKRVSSLQNSSFIVISSIAAVKSEPGILAYSATKAAINNLVFGAAKELAPIRINAVAPGFLKTEMTENFDKVYTEEFISGLDNAYPLGIPTVKNVVDTLLFLLSESSAAITGQVITVDGGGGLL